MNTVGVMTILEGPLADEARRLWRLFEEQYGSVGVQTFAHPNLTFSAGRCDDCDALDAALAQVVQYSSQKDRDVFGKRSRSFPENFSIFLATLPWKYHTH